MHKIQQVFDLYCLSSRHPIQIHEHIFRLYLQHNRKVRPKSKLLLGLCFCLFVLAWDFGVGRGRMCFKKIYISCSPCKASSRSCLQQGPEGAAGRAGCCFTSTSAAAARRSSVTRECSAERKAVARTWSYLILGGQVAPHSESHARVFESCKLKHSGWGLEIHPALEFLLKVLPLSARKEHTFGLHLQVEC